MIKDIFIRMFGIFISRFLIFITSIIIARIVTEAEWGSISLTMSYFSLLLIFSGNILNRAVVTYTAQSINNIIYSNQILYLCNRLSVSIAFIIIIIFYLVLHLFSPISDKIAENGLITILPCIIIVLISQNIISYFQGRGNLKYMTILELLRAILQSIILVYFTYFMFGPLHGWVYGRLLGLIFIFTVFLIILWKKYTIHIFHWPVIDKEIYYKIKRFFKWAYIASILSVAVRGVDVIIISEYFNNSHFTGIFKLSIIFFTAFSLFGQSITSALYHRFAKLADRKKDLYNFSLKIKIITIPIYIIISVFLFIFSVEIIYLLFGDKYQLINRVINIIIIASIFNTYILINGGIWSAIGDMKLNTVYFSVYSISYILLLFFTISNYGFLFFPYSILIISILGAIYSELLLRKRLLF